MKESSCQKTLTGEHIWNEESRYIANPQPLQISIRGEIVELIRCRACGMVDDRVRYQNKT